MKTVELSGVPETMLLPLWFKAAESRHANPIIKDTKAVSIVADIDYDFSKFKNAWKSQVGVGVRTMLFDKAVNRFLNQNEEAVIINLGAGLDTRYERLDKNRISCWYDLDLPEAIALRRKFFTETSQRKFIAKSMFDFSWIEDIDIENKPVLIIAEGLFMYFHEEQIRTLFDRLVSFFPEAEVLLETLTPFLVGKSKQHDCVKHIKSNTEFYWGISNPRELEGWNRRLIYMGDWVYSDYHRGRWKWIGLLTRIPALRRKFACRLVHMKVNN